MFNRIKNKYIRRILNAVSWVVGIFAATCILFYFYPRLFFSALDTPGNISNYYRKIFDPCYAVKEFNPKKDYLVLGDRVCVRYNRCGSISKLKTVHDAEAKTFESLGDNYGKDKNNIYYDGKKITIADIETFKILGHTYAKDKNNAYYAGKKIDGADLDTFTIIDGSGWSGAQDKNYKYFGGGKIKH